MGFFELGLLRDRPDDPLPLTVPDFLVEDVRLDAAAARFTVLFAELLADPRGAVERDADARVVLVLVRGDFPAAAFLLALPRVPDFVAVDFAASLRPALFTADLAALLTDRVADFTALLAVVLRALLRPVDLAADLVERAVLLAALLAAPRVAGLAAERVAPLFVAVPRLAAVERDEDAVDLAADFRAVLFAAVFFAVVFFAVDFRAVVFAALFLAVALAPLLRADVVFDAAAFPPVEARRVPLFRVERDVGLSASTAPVISWVSGFDLSSVGIAASFKGLRVQPSRLQGNVVIPSEFLLTESVESRTGTIPVDTFCTLRAAVRFSALRRNRTARFRGIFRNRFKDMPRSKQLESDRANYRDISTACM